MLSWTCSSDDGSKKYEQFFIGNLYDIDHLKNGERDMRMEWK